jgi:hypothetical protein
VQKKTGKKEGPTARARFFYHARITVSATTTQQQLSFSIASF